MPALCRNCGHGRWYPTPIHCWESFLTKLLSDGQCVIHLRELRKNIAYNLQYLGYLSQTLDELDLSDVLRRQTYKAFVVTGAGVWEAILFYLLRANGLQKVSDWEQVGRSAGHFKAQGKDHRIENVLHVRRATPAPEEMSLDQMIKIAEKHKLLGREHLIYAKLNYLRRLRNRVHLHLVEQDTDTDYWQFTQKDMDLMKLLLSSLFLSSLFTPAEADKKLFAFLTS